MRDGADVASIEAGPQPIDGHRQKLRTIYQQLDRSYVPGRFGGRVTLIRGREEAPDVATESNWWRAVAADVERDPLNLIEALADRIALTCLRYDAVQCVEVTVHKPQAPMPVDVADVTVTLTRSKTT